jgi:hypothetical protein
LFISKKCKVVTNCSMFYYFSIFTNPIK